MRSKKIMPLGILLLGIGFATVTTTLLMTGNVKIATNDADFDVKFTKVTFNGEHNVTYYYISADGKTITFPTSNLITVGDVSKVDFEVTNNSELYDAEVSILCTATGPKKSYYSIHEEVATPIEAKTTKAGKVEVTLTKAPVDDIHEDFTCTLTATAKERASKAEAPKIYYEFGNPTTSSTQDYTTLTYPYSEYNPEAEGKQAKVFVKLELNQKSVCTLATGSLECFKIGGSANAAEEQDHVKRVFGETNCSSGYGVSCRLGTFNCIVVSSGYVECSDDDLGCSGNFDGNVTCR